MADGLGKRAEKVYCHLRGLIEEGRLLPGRRLPTQYELSAQFRISRSTVQTALGRLCEEGFVEGRRGSGMFVRRTRVEVKVPPVDLIGIMCESAQADGFALQEQLLRYEHLACFHFQRPSRWSPFSERVYLKQLLHVHPKALIACCSPLEPPNADCLTRLAESGCRVIHVAPFRRHLPAEEYFMPDYLLAGYRAGAALVAAGYDHFFYSAVAADGPFAWLMEDGFADALRQNGQEYRRAQDYVEMASLTTCPSSAARRFRDALDRDESIGIFTRSGWLANVIRHQLEEWQVRIPEQVGIITHENLLDRLPPEGKGFDTISFDAAEIMRQALVHAVSPETEPIRELVPPAFVSRGTVRE